MQPCLVLLKWPSLSEPRSFLEFVKQQTSIAANT